VFPRNQYGEVKGELHYDPESGHLVALTDGNGSFVVSLDGDVVAHMPDLSLARPPSHGDLGSRYSGPDGWSYAPQHRMFYRWIDGAGIEERALPTACQPT
jgi:glycosyltransferase involved in cell wall biosynthesis